jgi:hypothetical protein
VQQAVANDGAEVHAGAGPTLYSTTTGKMIFLFNCNSLTHAVDKQIHRTVLFEAFATYWAFRLSWFLEKFFFALAVLSVFTFQAIYIIARHNGEPNFPDSVYYGFAKLFVSIVLISAASGTACHIFLKKLKPIVNRAAAAIQL